MYSQLCTKQSNMEQRVTGFDLARAYAIFGMYIVNFNIIFGDDRDQSLIGQFLSLFSGNSSTVFVMLAGMGIALMSSRQTGKPEDKRRIRNTVIRRACFLGITGLLFCLWWPADILHFYGVYMLIAALLLFVNRRYYLVVSLLSILIFHVLLVLIPYESGWNFDTLAYMDFWTAKGLIRNTFYNGWNAAFPWFAYFTMGMYLGRMDWTRPKVQLRMFIIGLCMFLVMGAVQYGASSFITSEEILAYVQANYLPPTLPFVISTMGFGFMLIAACMLIGKHVSGKPFAQHLAQVGKMTLTHYVAHLTIGMLVFAALSGKEYAGLRTGQAPAKPIFLLLFSIAWFVLSYQFSKMWAKRYKNGPLEMLMRKISG